jgi:serine-type D-Ala-D-Ala carboxypeptidase/endopeptidase (penicillin-binding protein 4)
MVPRILRVSAILPWAAALMFASSDVRSDPSSDGGSAASSFVPALQAASATAASGSLSGASVGIAIVDVDSGRWLAAVNEHLALNPASNAKLYTAGAALAILRGEHRYETTLSGKVEGERVSGSLAIRGFGDPSLKTSDLWAMVLELKAYGVKRVDGDIVVDQEFYDDLTTPPAFEQQPNEWAAFRAPVSAVALDENCITLTVRPSAGGAPAQVEVDPPGFVDLDGTVRTVQAGSADDVQLALVGDGLRMSAHVSGAIGADSRLVRYTRRADDPRLLAGYALKALLERADVKVSGGVKLGSSQGRVLAKHASEPVSTLLYGLGKQSDNFYAEMIFKSLAGEAKHRPAKSTDAGELVAGFVERIGASDPGVVFKNGSGLFDADRVTAFGTATLLRWAWRDPEVEPEYLAQLAVGGVDGTLHKRFRSELTKRRVRAKTGTLDDAIALSGYVLREGKGPIAFSILYNRVAGKQDIARRSADRLVDLIAKTYP